MRFVIAPFVMVTLLVAASLVFAQDASDTTTSQYEALKHSILVLKFGRSPDGQQIPYPDCFNRAPWDRRSWFGGMDPCTPAEHDEWLTDIRRWRDESSRSSRRILGLALRSCPISSGLPVGAGALLYALHWMNFDEGSTGSTLKCSLACAACHQNGPRFILWILQTVRFRHSALVAPVDGLHCLWWWPIALLLTSMVERRPRLTRC